MATKTIKSIVVIGVFILPPFLTSDSQKKPPLKI